VVGGGGVGGGGGDGSDKRLPGLGRGKETSRGVTSYQKSLKKSVHGGLCPVNMLGDSELLRKKKTPGDGRSLRRINPGTLGLPGGKRPRTSHSHNSPRSGGGRHDSGMVVQGTMFSSGGSLKKE